MTSTSRNPRRRASSTRSGLATLALEMDLHLRLIPIRVVVDSDVIRRGATPPDSVTV